MTAKPEYINLLNDIRLQEHRAGVYLEAWAEKTANVKLKDCLSFVAAREYSHGDIFDRRIRELGFETESIEDPDFEEKVRVVTSEISDAEKITWLKEARLRQPTPSVRDRYEAATNDESVDPLTRSLLRWFTDVENDSVVYMGEVYGEIEKTGQ
jgi:rubrerythrin